MTEYDPFEILTFTAPWFAENAYLVGCGSGVAVAVDPGGEAERMANTLDARGWRLEAILLTHAHIDHIEGVAELKRRTGAPIHLHPDDAQWYERAADQAAIFGYPITLPPPVDRSLAHGETLTFGERTLEVRHVPGHSRGHVIFHDAAARVAFVGDVIFAGSIGRTDLPGGDYRQLMQSIREQVLTLPDDTVLHSGHGPRTTVGHERKSNPFLVGDTGSRGFA